MPYVVPASASPLLVEYPRNDDATSSGRGSRSQTVSYHGQTKTFIKIRLIETS
jgi:hypothetical protein